jgi:hypothetical protein
MTPAPHVVAIRLSNHPPQAREPSAPLSRNLRFQMRVSNAKVK